MSIRNGAKNRKGKNGKRMLIGFALSALIFPILNGCGDGGDDNTDDTQGGTVPIENTSEVGNNEENGAGRLFIIDSIEEEDGMIMAYLIAANEAGEAVQSEGVQVMGLFEGMHVEIEEGNSGSRAATVEDILEGDLIRMYVTANDYEKIVIIR